MNFTVQKANLMTAMNVGIRAIMSGGTIPLLHNFLIEVSGMDGTITSTDLQTTIKASFSCMANEDGKMCVDAKTLVSMVKKMGKDEITFQTDGDMVIVTGAKARYELAVASNIDEYPHTPTLDDSVRFTIDGNELRKMIDGVAFAVSTKTSNRAITGINMRIRKGSMRLSALDLVRVAIRTADTDCKDDVDVIIPVKTMVELSKSIIDEDVDIEVSKNLVRFTFNSTTITSRLIDGKFFNMDQILGKESNISVKCDKKELTGTIDRALVIYTTGDDKKPIVFDIKDDLMNVSFITNKSKFDEDLPCEKSGGDIRIGLNPNYVLDALKAIEDDELTLTFLNDISPLFIKAESGAYVYVVLPVTIK